MKHYEVKGYVNIPITVTVLAKDEDDAMEVADKVLADRQAVFEAIDDSIARYTLELEDAYKLAPWEQ